MRRYFIVTVVVFAALLILTLYVRLSAPPVLLKYLPDLAVEVDQSDALITLQRTMCLGSCPAYGVTIRGDGTVVYSGENWVEFTGEHESRIPVDSVARLIKEIFQSGYFSMQDLYLGPTDVPGAFTSFRIGTRYKTIKDYGSGPNELKWIEKRIDEIANTERWTGVKKRRAQLDSLRAARPELYQR